MNIRISPKASEQLIKPIELKHRPIIVHLSLYTQTNSLICILFNGLSG